MAKKQMKKNKVRRTFVKKKEVKRKKENKKVVIRKTSSKKEFICPRCGYEAFKMAKLSQCPLCVICSGCGKEVRKCKCKEGE